MSKIGNDKERKPTAKKSFSLADFKKNLGVEDSPEKDISWYKCSKAIEDETGLPGVPRGYVTLARGFTNTGKSTLLCEAVVSAQKMGDFPIIIDTENNLGRKRLESMGFDWNGNYILLDNEGLLMNYGKKQNKDRNEASIEDMSVAINDFLDLQEEDKLPFNLCFAIDSLGTLDCIKTIDAQEKGSSDNNMWNANAFEKSFKYLINSRIPASRKTSRKYINTVIAVQKIWIDNMGNGVVKHKGGEAFFYGSRLIFHFGGIAAHGTKKVSATSKKREVVYGIKTKIEIIKNQLNSELGGIALAGEIISTPHGFIGATSSDIEMYKKKNILYFRDLLGHDIDPDDIKTTYSNIDDSVDIDDFKANLENFENNI